MYLLDTNVISELRKTKPHGAVVAWLQQLDNRDIYLSAMVVGEVQAGIELTRRQDADKAREIESWLSQVVATFQILSLDGEVCREWARLIDRRSKALTEDALIAATAKVHGFTLATRNVRDFQGWGLQLVNPFTFVG
jgi:predicted nucleic acid-binding protein